MYFLYFKLNSNSREKVCGEEVVRKWERPERICGRILFVKKKKYLKNVL